MILTLFVLYIYFAEIDDRLLLSVRKPAVVNSTFNSLTVGMLTATLCAWSCMGLNVRSSSCLQGFTPAQTC